LEYTGHLGGGPNGGGPRPGDPEIDFFIMCCDILNSLSRILNQRDDGDDVVTHPQQQQQQQKRKTKTSPLSLSPHLLPPPTPQALTQSVSTWFISGKLQTLSQHMMESQQRAHTNKYKHSRSHKKWGLGMRPERDRERERERQGQQEQMFYKHLRNVSVGVIVSCVVSSLGNIIISYIVKDVGMRNEASSESVRSYCVNCGELTLQNISYFNCYWFQVVS
jgi:hypothetical protein